MPTRPKMTDEEIEIIQRLISEGMGDSAIAAQVGRHRTSVVKVRAGTRRKSVTTGGKQLQVGGEDESLLERLDLKVDDMVNQLIAFVGAGRRKTFVRAVFPPEGPIDG